MEYPNLRNDHRQWTALKTDFQTAIKVFLSGSLADKLSKIPYLCNYLHILKILQTQDLPSFVNSDELNNSIEGLLKLIKQDFENEVILTAMMNSWYLYCHSDMLGDIISHFIGLTKKGYMVKSMLRGLFINAMKLDSTLLPIVTPRMVEDLNVDGQEVMRQVKSIRRQRIASNQARDINPDVINHRFLPVEEFLTLQQYSSTLPFIMINKIILHVLGAEVLQEEDFQGIIQNALKQNVFENYINHFKIVEEPKDPRVRYEEETQDLDIFEDIEADPDAIEVLLEEILNYSEYFTDSELEIWKDLSSYIYGQQLSQSDQSQVFLKLQDQVQVLLKIAYFLYYRKPELYEDFVHLSLKNSIKQAVRFISELPKITDNTMQLIGELCTDSIDMIPILQEIILHKPKQRTQALTYLLKCCISENKVMRAQAVSVARSINLDVIIPQIKQSAIEEFSKVDFSVPDDKKDEISRQSELFMSLLIKDPSLFGEFVSVYNKIEEKADLSKTLLTYLQQLENYDTFIHYMEQSAKSCPELVIEIVTKWSDRVLPSLIELVKSLVDSQFSPKILLPVLHAFDKNDIVKYISYIFNEDYEEAVVKQCLSKLLLTIGDDNVPKLTASELLVLVHAKESELTDSSLALAYVLTLPEIQDEKVLTESLEEMLKLGNIPELTMVTLEHCIEEHSNMIEFITKDLLSIMVRKRIWDTPSLWHNFIRICGKTQPQCFGVVLDLPKNAFKELIERESGIRESLKQIINNSEHLRHSNRIRPLLPILEAAS
eukprot:NODE_62_length_26495_cov_0.832853.p2 type:complete len:772 gc:universal NODE_62_length_26495_cov_0.832853:13065-10750(-)